MKMLCLGKSKHDNHPHKCGDQMGFDGAAATAKRKDVWMRNKSHGSLVEGYLHMGGIYIYPA